MVVNGSLKMYFCLPESDHFDCYVSAEKKFCTNCIPEQISKLCHFPLTFFPRTKNSKHLEHPNIAKVDFPAFSSLLII